MKVTLQNFETALPEVIVQRGADYHFMGAVGNVARDGHTYVATVFGSEEYTVEIEIQDGQIEHWFCNCPYDGQVCKHVIAVLYEARKLAGAESSGERSAADNPVEDILSQLNKQELRELLRFLAQRDEEARLHLITKYSHLIPDTGKAYYKKLVGSVVDAHSRGRYGFIEYKDADRLGHELWKLLHEASESTKPAGEMQLVYLCEEVIRQLAKAYQSADDSSGSMGSAMELAFHTLFGLTEQETPPAVLKYLYKLAMQEHKVPLYQGWDWPGTWRDIAVHTARDRKQADALIEELDELIGQNQGKSFSERYEAGQAAEQKLRLLEEWYPEQAPGFLEDHLYLQAFRERALEQAMRKKQHEHVRQLAEDGIRQALEEKLPGLVKKWEQWLLRLAQETGDRAAHASLLEQLFLDTRDMKYYRELKGLLPEDQFKNKVERFIRHFQEKVSAPWRGYFNDTLAAIYLEENRMDELMEMLRSAGPSLYTLDRYASQLAKKYPAIYRELYAAAVLQAMEKANNRQDYRGLMPYLTKITRLGGEASARQLATEWRDTYPRRRAMLEELKKAGW